MLKSKANWTCSYCSRIFRDPILLPCGDSICRDHLKDRDVVKENRIKCKKCNDEFQIKDNEFITNNDLKTLVESQSYLSEEELDLKKVLEDSIENTKHEITYLSNSLCAKIRDQEQFLLNSVYEIAME